MNTLTFSWSQLTSTSPLSQLMFDGTNTCGVCADHSAGKCQDGRHSLPTRGSSSSGFSDKCTQNRCAPHCSRYCTGSCGRHGDALLRPPSKKRFTIQLQGRWWAESLQLSIPSESTSTFKLWSCSSWTVPAQWLNQIVTKVILFLGGPSPWLSKVVI